MQIYRKYIKRGIDIADRPLQQRIINYLSTHDYGNEAEVNKIYQLLK